MRKIISLITIICLCVSILCAPALAENIYLDPLNTITVKQICEANYEIDLTADKQTLGRFDGIMRHFAFDIDFGDEGVRLMEVTYSCHDSYGGGKVMLYLDSMDDNPVFEFGVEGTGGYDTAKTFRHLMDEPITGKHRVYFLGSKNWTCKLWRFKFESAYTIVTEPTFTLYDGEGTETNDEAAAANLSVDASVLNYAATGATANLLLVAYDSNFKKLAPIAIDTKTNINDVKNPTALNLKDDYSSDTVFFAVLLDDEFKAMGDCAFLGAPAPTVSLRNTDNEIDYYIDGTSVTVFGALEDGSTKSLIGVRDSDVGLGEYADYEFIYETAVTDGKYEHTFVMDDNTPTGSYTAVFSSDGGSCNEVTFHYSRPLDIVDAFQELNASSVPTDDDTIETEIDNELNQWKDTLGLTEKLKYIEESEDRTWMYTQIHGYLPFADLNELNNAIDKTVFLHKVNTTDGDVATAEAYKSVIGLADMDYYKTYYKDIDKEKLETKLGTLMPDDTPLTNVADFVALYREAIALVEMSGHVSWGSADKAIGDFELIIDAEHISDYLELDEEWRKVAATEFLYKDFGSAKEISDLLDSSYKLALDAKKDAQEDDNDDRKVSSGGGGGGGSFKVETPKEEKEEKEEIVQPQPASPAPKAEFTDISGHAWAQDAIIYLAEKGIVNGKSDNLYCPADKVSREEFIKIIVMAFGVLDEGARCNFADVSESAWYYPYVATAYKRGWVTGYEDGSFGVGKSITREQMATMFHRAIEDTDGPTEVINSAVAFVDYTSIGAYALEPVMSLARSGIMNGTGMGLFSPKNNATRAETAALVYKYLFNR